MKIAPWRSTRWGSPIAWAIASAAWPQEARQLMPDSAAATCWWKKRSLPPDAETLKQIRKAADDDDLKQAELEVSFTEKHRNWPLLIYSSRRRCRGRPWCSNIAGGRMGEDREEPAARAVAAAGWFNPDRGMLLKPNTFLQTAKSFREAISLAADKTVDSTLLVYRSIHKVGSGQVSARYFGGPIWIVRWALQMAKKRPGNFLLFLTMISANLAVINFLPIPVLDGGHIVFLAWEGIRGKPADERVQLALTYCGLLLILALMVWVLGLDLDSLPGRGDGASNIGEPPGLSRRCLCTPKNPAGINPASSLGTVVKSPTLWPYQPAQLAGAVNAAGPRNARRQSSPCRSESNRRSPARSAAACWLTSGAWPTQAICSCCRPCRTVQASNSSRLPPERNSSRTTISAPGEAFSATNRAVSTQRTKGLVAINSGPSPRSASARTMRANRSRPSSLSGRWASFGQAGSPKCPAQACRIMKRSITLSSKLRGPRCPTRAAPRRSGP